ncbi:MAG: hypothetical protein R6V29_14540 [Spirochaetia bacterium]
MPWRVCSKVGSKKSRAHRNADQDDAPGRGAVRRSTATRGFARARTATPALIVRFAVVLLFASPPELPADELTLHTDFSEEAGVTLRVEGAPTLRITNALNGGMRARLDLVLRVVEHVEGPAGFLGDRVVREWQIAKEAFYDPFAEAYAVETYHGAGRTGGAGEAGDTGGAGRTVRLEAETADAIEELLTLREVELPRDPANSTSDKYVLAQARLKPLLLAENLRLLALAIPEYVVRSPWVQIDGAADAAGAAGAVDAAGAPGGGAHE